MFGCMFAHGRDEIFLGEKTSEGADDCGGEAVKPEEIRAREGKQREGGGRPVVFDELSAWDEVRGGGGDADERACRGGGERDRVLDLDGRVRHDCRVQCLAFIASSAQSQV